jgi:hypothetical protein
LKNIRIKLLVLFFFIAFYSIRTQFAFSTTFQDLEITPKEPYLGENVTIRFKLNNTNIQGGTVGFIIEHHPPAYLMDDNTSQRYPQIAKSVLVPQNQMISYKYELSSNYTGVNVIVIYHEGSQVLAETFTVQEPDVAFIGEGSISKVAVIQVIGYLIIGALVLTALILIIKRI